MKVYRQLVRAFMRSGEMDNPKQKKQKLFYILLGIISIFGIMLPCCLFIGYFAYAFTLSLSGGKEGLLLIVHFISLFSIVFGIGVILNVFYFAGDIEFILPLPIAPGKIIAAKFTTAYRNETVMQMLVLASAFIGFFIGMKGSIWMYGAAFIGILTLPLAPLVYCGIICMLLMAFTKWIKNKDNVRKLAVFFTFLLMFVAASSVGLLKGIDLENFTVQLLEKKVAFVNVMNVVFPTNRLFLETFEKHSILPFFLYLFFNVVLLAAFLCLAQLLYFKGLTGMVTSSGKSKNVSYNLKSKGNVHKLWVSYLMKEWKILFRTPAFFTNCLVINLLWPVLFYVICIMQKDNHVLRQFYVEYNLGNEGIHWFVTLLVLIVTVLLTAANSIASSAVTREGKQYTFMKHIPVSYKTQLNVKALLSIIISGGMMVIYIVIVSVVLKIENITSYFYIIISVLEVVFITYFGLYLDTINPKLIWDDELNALRGNTNIFFNMAYAMIWAVVFTAVMMMIYLFTPVPLRVMEFLLILLLVILDVGMYRYCIRKGEKNLQML